MIRPVIIALFCMNFFLTGASAQIAAPLSSSDATTYRNIFNVQDNGNWSKADALINQLSDRSLMGHVLYQRYMHPTAYRSTYGELTGWLDRYSDHPDANKVYELARKRRTSGSSAPVKPQKRRWRTQDDATRWLHPTLKADYANSRNAAEVRRIENYVRHLNREDRPSQALNYISSSRYRNQLTIAQYDRIRSWIAASYYYNEKTVKAKSIAKNVADRSGDQAVLSYWIAGLTSYRDGEKAMAANYFRRMAAVPYQTPELRSAAGFWAARVSLENGELDYVVPNLKIATRSPFTFYGQLALAQLGQDTTFNWITPTLSIDDWSAISQRNKRLIRAAGLAQAGQYEPAQTELRWAHGELSDADDATLQAIAFDLNLWAAQVTMALASGAENAGKSHLQAGLFPVPGFMPNGGFQIDRAVLYGLIRQESKFMTDARSRAGAVGLMQLMPRTASFVAGDKTLQYRSQRSRLSNPSYNMQLGQSYVQELLSRHTDNDLVEMTLAYNWGPGNLRRYKQKTGITDQLLMLESIPNPEARDFVEYVMTNIWIYRNRLGQPAPTREALASGQKPLYRALD